MGKYSEKYDVVIIGSGIAGMSAGIYLKRNNMSVLIIENNTPGGELNRSSVIENYPGYASIDGPTLAYNIYNQVNKLEIDYLFDELVSIDYDNKIVNTDSDKISYKYLIIATGRSPKELDILTEYKNNGVSYCALCDGNLYKNKDIIVVGGGNSAFEEALYLSKICKSVTILNRSNNLRADVKEIEKVNNTENICVVLNEEINTIEKKDDLFIVNNKYEVSGIFVCIGYIPNSKLFDVEKENDYIIVDNHCKTNKKDVYAVGDVIKKEIYQLITASSEGITAAYDIIKNQK